MTPEQNALFDLVTWDFPGAAIEAESFRRIEAEVPPEQRARFSPSEWHIARRLVHTTADFEILPHLRFHGDPVGAGRAALRRGALIYSDSNMIKAGLSVPKLIRATPAIPFSAKSPRPTSRSWRNAKTSPARSRRSNSMNMNSTARYFSAATLRSRSRE